MLVYIVNNVLRLDMAFNNNNNNNNKKISFETQTISLCTTICMWSCSSMLEIGKSKNLFIDHSGTEGPEMLETSFFDQEYLHSTATE